MINQIKICQSCGMLIMSGFNKFGTNVDKSLNEKYCNYCYKDGNYTDDGITINEKIDKQIIIMIEKMSIPEKKARQLAESLLPNLERWE